MLEEFACIGDALGQALALQVEEGKRYAQVLLENRIVQLRAGTGETVDVGLQEEVLLPIQRFDSTGQLWYGRIGDSQPLMRFGFQNSFRYHNFRLFVQTTGQFGGDVYANSNQTYYASGDHPVVSQAGRPDELKKPVAYYNRVSNNNNLYLANFVESGTHLTISELLFGYTAEAKRWPFLSRVGVSRAQLDLIGRNMRTFTNYTGLNVMAGSPTVRFDDATYPMTRTLTGVVTLTF